MKKKYYYFRVSFMSKVQKDALVRSDATVANEVKRFHKNRFPLIAAIQFATNYFKDTAIPESIQVHDCIEISKEDYEAFNKLRTSQREPNDNKKEEKP